MRDVADGQFPVGSYDEAASFALSLTYEFEFTVVHQIATIHCLNHLRVVSQSDAHQGHQLGTLLGVTIWLGEDDHVTVVADAFEIF